MLPAPEACSPLPKHCIRAHSVRSIWKCIEAASAYVCQRTRTHPVWKLEERPSAFHCKLVTVTDSPCRFGYCTLRCAQLHSVLQSHLLAERVTVVEKKEKKKQHYQIETPTPKPQAFALWLGCPLQIVFQPPFSSGRDTTLFPFLNTAPDPGCCGNLTAGERFSSAVLSTLPPRLQCRCV